MACLAECIQTGCPIFDPSLDSAADVLWPVIAANHLGLAPLGNDLLQSPDHPVTGQREVHLDTQCLTVEIINDI